jgi:hypothetical protein
MCFHKMQLAPLQRGHLCRAALQDFGDGGGDDFGGDDAAGAEAGAGAAGAAGAAGVAGGARAGGAGGAGARQGAGAGAAAAAAGPAAGAAAAAAATGGLGPTVVAFAGKRQYQQLFDRPTAQSVTAGLQPPVGLHTS